MVRRRKVTIGVWGAVCLLCLGVVSVGEAAEPGSVGLLSLRLGVGAREAGMGDAGLASSFGASAIYWNPANNVFGNLETELILQHHRYLSLFNQESAAVAHRLGSGVVGVFFSGLYADTIERRGLDNTGVVAGTFDPYDVTFGVSYAHRLGESFGLAINTKLVYERIDIYSDTGFAFDFFVTHKAVIDGLVFAASATNLGGQMKLKDQPFDLPAAFSLGTAYTPSGGWTQGKITFAADALFPNDTTNKGHLGLEYRILPEFALRVGSRLNYTNQGMTAGAGFRTGILGVDYAYSESTEGGLADGHKFSLNLVW